MPAFVILEHQWNGVHWDFMLESGEMLRTWAIDAPLVFNLDLPARALPDHRRAYLDFEGQISRGRGTVHRVDRGTYEVQDWAPDRVRVRISGSFFVGNEVVLARRSRPGDEDSSDSDWLFRLGKVD